MRYFPQVIRDQPADAISLKLGINMMASHNVRTFIPGVVGMLQVKAILVCLPENSNHIL